MRLDEADVDELDRRAAIVGLSRTEYVRRCCLGGAAVELAERIISDLVEFINDALTIREAEERDTGRRHSLDDVLARWEKIGR